MKILITGASGLIGSQLSSLLSSKGDTVIPCRLRSDSQVIELTQILDEQRIDAIIHLAGETVSQRWTEEKMASIKESRIAGTKIICEGLSKTQFRPKTFICASAIGYYGNRGDEIIDEQGGKGKGFLADVCQAWEETANEAKFLGIRVVSMRIGVVLSKKGGALGKMLLPFELGAGGQIGSGQQYMSWVDIDDVCEAIYFALTNTVLSGPVNTVAPNAVTNKEFTNTFGKVLFRPTFFPIPTFGLHAMFGPMADELLINGQNVVPSKLTAAGFKFQYPELEQSLRHVLNK